jgi:RNA methyltransferase, TrmH family
MAVAEILTRAAFVSPGCCGKQRSSVLPMLSSAEAKRLRSLAAPRQRADTGLFLVEGVRLVEDLLASSVVPRTAVISSSLGDTARGSSLADRLRERVRTVEVPDHQIRAIASTDTPQGVVVAAEIPRHSLHDIVLRDRECVVLLDAVQDPGNFGTIVRSADAFGAAFACALPGTVDPWNPKSVRSAAGSSLRVPIVHAAVDEVVDYLRSAGFVLIGADMQGASIATFAAPQRSALVVGNEGAGLRAEVRAALDGTVAVPIRGAAESLNVGVAAGILLFMLSREL